MPYQGTKTWGAEPWTYPDANAYIRDNFVSVRRYQVAPQYFIHTNLALTTSIATFAAHSNLCPTTPDEATRLIVMIFAQVVAGATQQINIGIRDQTGTEIAPISPTQSYSMLAGENRPISLAGGSLHALNINPGFDVRMSTSTSTATVHLTAVALVVPQA